MAVFSFGVLLAGWPCHPLNAQQTRTRTWTWQQLREKFEATNPTLKAGELNIEESRAQEVTAGLRPNPDLTVLLDQVDPITPNPYRPLQYTQPTFSTSYLHEREHKRELRVESARKGTTVAVSEQEDLKRNLVYNLRNAFVQTLEAKAIRAVAQDNLTYYDRVLSISRTQLQAGDISQVDEERLQLQRVQYEAELQAADINLRTAKIQLLALMNDRTPIDQFDVTGTFDFAGPLDPLESFRNMALEARPDLKAAAQAVGKAQTDHRLAISNGSADPTFSVDIGRNPPIQAYVGFSVNIPLRIFDKNQGEKERTDLEIHRAERLQEAATAQVFSDVDSAWAAVNSNLALLESYKEKYLNQALKVRDTMTFAYQRGGASLLDFLSAQNDYRSIQLNYLNLVGSCLTAANQLNLAVGREVVQ